MNTRQSILKSISAYVPYSILQRVLHYPEISLEGWQERSEAVLLFADVSGFTAMSETLAQLGKEGAEELTRVLNDYFATMIDLIRDYGGFVIKFGGDAMTCQFSGGTEGLLCACACALEMQQRMAHFQVVETRAGAFTLRMKIGISGGNVLSLSVGQRDQGLEYVLVGKALDRMAEAEHCANAGEILVDGDYIRRLDSSHGTLGLMIAEHRGPFWHITGIDTEVHKALQDQQINETAWRDVDERALAQLEAYLPQNVLEQITAGYHEFVGEHRQVVSLFVNFFGLDFDEDLEAGEKLQQYFVAMQKIIQQHGGRLNRLITGDKGSLLHIIFGAPVTYEDNEQRAVGCALQMQARISPGGPLSFITDQRMGLASGYVFAGNVGSGLRQEYTVMGDVVNLSARLMQAAEPGSILMDERTARRVEEEFRCEILAPIRVKGKQDPVSVCRPLGVHEEKRTWSQAHSGQWRRAFPLVGRRQELADVQGLLAQVSQGRGQLLVINGEAGVGKSRFLEEVLAVAHRQGAYSLGGNCLSYGAQTPYLPWIEIFTTFFNLSQHSDETVEAKLEKITQRMRAVDPALADWAPLMAQLLGLPAPDNALTSALNAQLRKQRVFDITLALLRHQAEQSSMLILIFEDLHWADVISVEMLNYVARNIENYPMLLTAVHRPTIALSEWHRYAYYTYIELTDLPAEDALELAKFKLGMYEIPEQLKDLILKGESRVNPFFVEELLNTLMERKYLIPDGEKGEYILAHDLSRVEIPEGVQALVMSRIDGLDERSKLTVKVASVIGRTFKQQVLYGIYPVSVTQTRLHKSLHKLSTLDLTPLDKPAPDWEYIFRHIITQEVAYESLLYAHRRELHHKIATFLEQTHQHNLEEYYELLAHHYFESGDGEKSWEYLVKAGDKARQRYANDAAIARYTQALSIAPDEEQASLVHKSLGDVYQLTGKYDQALSSYRQALKFENLLPLDEAAIRREIAHIWGLQGRYEKAMQYVSLTLDTLEGRPTSAELARIYNDMGWIARRQGKYELALKLCSEGLEVVEEMSAAQSSPPQVQDELQHNLGSIYLRLGDYDQAIAYFERCIKAREMRGDVYEVGRSYLNLAVVYWGLSDFDVAADYMRDSLQTFQKIGYTHGIATCYNNLGVIFYTLGQYSQAIENYERSLHIRQAIGDVQGIADVYNNLGEVYHALGDRQHAQTYLKQAVQMFIELGDQATLFDAWRLLAEVELELGELAEALDYAQQALILAQELGNLEYEGIAHRVLGQIYRGKGALAQGLVHVEKSHTLLMTTGNKLELGRSYCELGTIELEMGQDQGREALEKAIEIFEELGLENYMRKAQAILG